MTSPETAAQRIAGRDVVELIEAGSPYARTLGPRVTSVGDGTVVLHLDPPDGLLNHVGGPHAATLFGLGETAGAGLIVSVFDDLVAEGGVPLIKGAEISYLSLALGPVIATARFVGDADGVRASFRERGVATFPVEISIATPDGTETSRMTAQMALKRF